MVTNGAVVNSSGGTDGIVTIGVTTDVTTISNGVVVDSCAIIGVAVVIFSIIDATVSMGVVVNSFSGGSDSVGVLVVLSTAQHSFSHCSLL